jgi:hypothetical protein
MPFSDLIAPYQGALSKDFKQVVALTGAPGKIEQDRLYFFRPIIITQDSLLFTAKGGRAGLDPGFGEFIRSVSAPQSMPTDQALGRLQYLDAAISSIPFVQDGELLKAMLPYYSPEKCGSMPG